MLKIFAYKKEGRIAKKRLAKLLLFLSKEEKERVSRFKNRHETEVYVLGRYYIKLIIASYLGVSIKKIALKINKYGKPVLASPKAIILNFNISHSGDWIVFAIGPSQLGIDIERIRKIDSSIANNYFHPEEIRYLYKGNRFIVDSFFKLWVLKESYIKAIGRGLSQPLGSFYFEFAGKKNEDIFINLKNNRIKWKFRVYEIDKKYKLAICSSGKSLPDKIKIIK